MSYTGSDLIAEGLAAIGVQHVFGIVSIHNMPILDAINRLGKTKIIDVRHEQAGTHAADGYARATGGLGVMIASTGPGTSNTVTGLYEARVGSSKVMVLTGQAETGFYGKGLPDEDLARESAVHGRPAIWIDSGGHIARSLDADGKLLIETERTVERGTLLWEEAGISYRLETGLSEAEAILLAESLR